MKKLSLLIYLIFLSPNIVLSAAVEIYALNQLDEYRGYCLDIKGHKLKAKTNKGLQAHTCYSYQGEIAVDQGFDSLKLSQNQFFLPAFDVCMEVASVSTSAPIKLSTCNSGALQKFEWDTKGRVHPISDRKLCVTIAQGQSRKGGGGSPVHLIRNLSLESCSDTLGPYQLWGARKIN